MSSRERRATRNVGSYHSLVIVLSLLSMARSRPADAQVPPAERQALIDLYNSTNGPSWKNHNNWLGAPGTECTWYGVTYCVGGSNVRNLILSGNNLSGTLPASLGNLTMLGYLDLSSNQLTGSLAPLSNVTSLTGFDLSSNQLTGSLDPILNLSSLSNVNLRQNNLTGSIPALTGLTKLQFFNVTRNQLTGTIPSLAGLTALQSFYVNRNQLTGTLPSLDGLPALTGFGANFNQLTGTLPSLTRYPQLQGFVVEGNQLTGTIPPLTGLTNLNTFDVGGNRLTGTIPSLAGLTSLQDFEVHQNQLTGTLPSLSGLTALQVFLAFGNGLTGSIPPITGLTSLIDFEVDDNQLTGELPSFTGHLALLYFTAGHNRLTGTVGGHDIGGLTNLQALLLQGNDLVGPLPDGLTQLTQLTKPGVLTDIGHNGLYTTDPSIAAFMDAKFPGWSSTQTVPPAGVSATPQSSTAVSVSWTPIAYTADAGSYNVYSATSAAGPYSLAASTASKSIGSALVSGLSPATTYYFTVETVTQPNASNANTVVSSRTTPVSATTSSCPTPAAPALTTIAPQVTSGQSTALSWTAAAGLSAGGLYEVSIRSGSAVSTVRTAGLSAVIPTTVSDHDTSLLFRVTAIQPCGATSAPSNEIAVDVRAAAATFVATSSGPSWTVARGGAAPTSSVTFKNVGGVTGALTLEAVTTSTRRTLAGAPFFTLSRSSLTLAPNEAGSVGLTPTAEALSVENTAFSGLLVATAAGTQLSTPVSLVVTPGTTLAGASVRSSVSTVTFSAPAGGQPSSQTITLTVDRRGTGPVYLSPAIGPGGAWLSLSGDPFANEVPASGQVTLTLTVDRQKRASDEISPVETLLRITPAGGDPQTDAAVIDVVDVDLVDVTPGAGARGGASGTRESLVLAPPGGSSFIVPSAVNAASGVGGGLQTFTSDGWLRNESGAAVGADLFFTPRDKNGLTDPGVLKASVSLPAGSTYRLADFVSSLFGVKGKSGQVEVRSSSPFALTLRTAVDSIQGADPKTRFGAEIPTVAYGSGVGKAAGPLLIPGVDEDATNRANLILVETTGLGVTALVTVRDGGGAVVGTTSAVILPYGQVQLDRIVSTVKPGAQLSGGSLGVEATDGAGKVAAVLTVIDNASGSFSAVRAQGTRPAAGSSRRAPLAVADTFVIPSAVRLTGANDTKFSTRLSLVNGVASEAHLTLAYVYYDHDDHDVQKVVEKPLVIAPRGAMEKSLGDDVIASFFQVNTAPESKGSNGFITIRGDIAKIVGFANVRAQVDPKDPGKGYYVAQIDGVFVDSPVLGLAGTGERTFAGAEEDDKKRTALVLLELGGQPASVLVTAYDQAGRKLGDRTYGVGALEYRQIDHVLVTDSSQGGLSLGPGPFLKIELRAQVVSPGGRVLAFLTINDNFSRNPAIYVLDRPGPPVSTIGF